MITVDHLPHLGGALKELRWQARMKQIEVCRRIGMTAPQISRYENGRETPNLESLVKILQAVGADLCDLQRVLLAQAAEQRQGEGENEAAAAPEPAAGDSAALAAAREPAVPDYVAEVAVGEARDEGERRIEGSSGLRHVVSGLVELNIEGLERLERRLQALEQRLARGGM